MEVKIEVFILFDREDRDLFLELKKHLASLENEGLITVWHEGQIVAGTDWRQAIDLHLQKASLVLLLVSAHFMASEAYTLAIQALAKHTPPEGYVVPVLLRAVDWENSPFGRLAPLPANKEPISKWEDQHDAFLDVVRGIRAIIKAYKQPPPQRIEQDDLLVTITTPDGNKYTANMPADTLVNRLLYDILSQWLPLTLGITGSLRFSLRPFSLEPKSTLREAGTHLELVSEALGPNERISLTVEDNQGKAYTVSVLLNAVVGQLADAFLETKSSTEEAVVEWKLSATKTKQLRLEASLYDQGVCDDALLRIYCIATTA